MLEGEGHDQRLSAFLIHLTVPAAQHRDGVAESTLDGSAALVSSHDLLGEELAESAEHIFLDAETVFRSEFVSSRFEHIQDLNRAIRWRISSNDLMAITERKRILIRGNHETAGRIVVP